MKTSNEIAVRQTLLSIINGCSENIELAHKTVGDPPLDAEPEVVLRHKARQCLQMLDADVEWDEAYSRKWRALISEVVRLGEALQHAA